jgi:hypothetical protein
VKLKNPPVPREEGFFLAIEIKLTPVYIVLAIFTCSLEEKMATDTIEATECTCPKTCICEDPPLTIEVNGRLDFVFEGGAYQIGDECPIHNKSPQPNPKCPVHGG